MQYFEKQGNALIFRQDGETVRVEPWQKDSLRVRGTLLSEIEEGSIALLDPEPVEAEIELVDELKATIKNGKIQAVLELQPWGQKLRITFLNQKGEVLLSEIANGGALCLRAHDYRALKGGAYQLKVSFDSNPDEKIYGMGQYQQERMNLKGCNLELAHRNSQASIPFYVSSLGYGFLWHNAAVGEVHFGTNTTEWLARTTKQLDYWVTAGDTPAEIEEHFADAIGKVPMMPEYGLGFWQCKLRYYNQEQVLNVAREYKKRGIPLDVFVIDYYHWPRCGDYRFDEEYFPDPKAMIDELHEMGIETMVSIWPQIDWRSENYEEMKQQGLLVKSNAGVDVQMLFHGNNVFLDATNPRTRKYVWEKVKKNYADLGIRTFWLDEAEPEYTVYDFENYRYHLGPDIQVGNIYPVMYAKTFFDGMKAEGQENIINLLRCAWAGSQKYGALVWSGDIKSSFPSMKNQVAAGLNMGIAGIPWWTTDIGGFFGANINDPEFHELLVRWFEYGCFCPVMRLHGYRWPLQPQYGTTGGATCVSGAPNEVWSYTDQVCEILSDYLRLRERMLPYITELMEEAHEKGTPVMRPLFYDFPEDKESWNVETEYMFGPKVLVKPITDADARETDVYLPGGASWTNAWTGETFEGGQKVHVAAPIEQIPLFTRDGYKLPMK